MSGRKRPVTKGGDPADGCPQSGLNLPSDLPDWGCWPGFDGGLGDGGFNIIEDPTGARITANKGDGTTQLNVDPLIAELADNGGGTETHALLEGSPAIDAADASNCVQLDQRGFWRTDGACDIGAFERGAIPNVLVFEDGFEI